MINSINDNYSINNNIPDDIRDYFNEHGINIDAIFQEEELLSEEINRSDISKIITQIRSLENKSNQHKVLLGTVLLELRSQIKKNQSQIANVNIQIDKKIKELDKKISDFADKNNNELKNLNKKLDAVIQYILKSTRNQT